MVEQNVFTAKCPYCSTSFDGKHYLPTVGSLTGHLITFHSAILIQKEALRIAHEETLSFLQSSKRKPAGE